LKDLDRKKNIWKERNRKLFEMDKRMFCLVLKFKVYMPSGVGVSRGYLNW
jgi:hypothetical protein